MKYIITILIFSSYSFALSREDFEVLNQKSNPPKITESKKIIPSHWKKVIPNDTMPKVFPSEWYLCPNTSQEWRWVDIGYIEVKVRYVYPSIPYYGGGC